MTKLKIKFRLNSIYKFRTFKKIKCNFCNHIILTTSYNNKKFCSRRCSTLYKHANELNFGWRKQKKKSENPAWKGQKVKYGSLHSWIKRNWGKAKICEFCNTKTAKVYDWSNKEHKISRLKKDWQQLCRSCHLKYDYQFNWSNV